MKKIKNFMLKGMIAGMTMITGIGAIAPAMANMSVYAAEEYQSVESYEHILSNEANNIIEAAKQQGNVISQYDNTIVIEVDGDIYHYTTYRYKEYAQKNSSGRYFFSESAAYDYAESRGWEDIKVTKNPEDLILWVNYYVEGYGPYVDLNITKEMNTSIQTISMALDKDTIGYEETTYLHVGVNEGANIKQVVVSSDNEDVATVEKCEDGTYAITGHTTGTVMLMANATDGSGMKEYTYINVKQ